MGGGGGGSNNCVNIHSFSHSFIYPSFKAWQALLKVLRIYRFLPLGYLIPPQFSSVAQSCPTLCNPMNRSIPWSLISGTADLSEANLCNKDL